MVNSLAVGFAKIAKIAKTAKIAGTANFLICGRVDSSGNLGNSCSVANVGNGGNVGHWQFNARSIHEASDGIPRRDDEP
jgi:hypothetical protein